jgi:hypothetical protein
MFIIRDKWFLAATYVTEKNKKLVQNILLLDFATILYFSQRHMPLPKSIFLVARVLFILY